MAGTEGAAIVNRDIAKIVDPNERVEERVGVAATLEEATEAAGIVNPNENAGAQGLKEGSNSESLGRKSQDIAHGVLPKFPEEATAAAGGAVPTEVESKEAAAEGIAKIVNPNKKGDAEGQLTNAEVAGQMVNPYVSRVRVPHSTSEATKCCQNFKEARHVQTIEERSSSCSGDNRGCRCTCTSRLM